MSGGAKAERLQKILARAGVASRRHAETLITEGRVRVNGHVVSELGAKADPGRDRIEVNGERLVAERFVYFIFHKPRGVVSTLSDPEGRPTVKDALSSIPERVFPVGRLDFSTSGALLVTNDGDFMNGLLHPKTDVPKTYVVKVAGKMAVEDLDAWRNGVRLEDGVTKPAEVKLDRYEDDKTWFYVTLTEGRNQQIRRMGEATGFHVMRLARVSFAGVTTEGLAPGRLRPLTRDELFDLRKKYGVPRRLPAPVAGGVRHGSDARGNSPRNARDNRTRDKDREKKPVMRSQDRVEKTEGPRYGGGSPGRRSYDVTADWGGGSGRGKSFSGEGSQSGGRGATPRGEVGGGRMGRTRTTGTAGGIGASRDADRVKGRRR